jgi:amidohydrolase
MSRNEIRLMAAAFALIPVGSAAAQSELAPRMERAIRDREAELIEIRRDIHRHPEVSGSEVRTSALVAKRLGSLGFEVRTKVGGHGVVGVLRGTKPGPVVAFRADMDAVPSDTPDPVDFRSLDPSVRHICGHDLHTTIGLALADGFAAIKGDLPGTVMLVFQPAEERADGAKAMLADGVFKPLKPDFIFAVHTAPFEVGKLAIRAGTMMAGREEITVKLEGKGNLDAAADSVLRVIGAASNITLQQALQPTTADDAIFTNARRAKPGLIEGEATVSGQPGRIRAKQQIMGALEALKIPGVTITPTWGDRAIVGVINDSALVARANASVRAALGPDAVEILTTMVPAFSEDFGSFQDLVPGAFYFLGVSNSAKGTVGMPHTPNYVADEAAIQVGARAMTAAMLDVLTGKRPIP